MAEAVPAAAPTGGESEAPASKSSHLAKQDLATMDPAKLNPLSPEVISRQATINIGTIGHVAHGKSTVVKAISGVHTVRFKNELERNITIKLGYANAKIYQCKDPECPRPGNFLTRGSSTEDVVKQGKWSYELVRHVSFVDCPGHDILMATMLNGAAVMDAALLLIAGNEPCPQPQTSEHLAAVEIMKLQHIIILQNKIDLVKEAAALQQYEDIKAFVKGTVADSSPIVPISAQLRCAAARASSRGAARRGCRTPPPPPLPPPLPPPPPPAPPPLRRHTHLRRHTPPPPPLAQVQHRRGGRVHHQLHPGARARLHERAQDDRHPLLRAPPCSPTPDR